MKNLKAGSVRQLHTACLVCTKHCVSYPQHPEGAPHVSELSLVFFTRRSWVDKQDLAKQVSHSDPSMSDRKHRPIESLETL